MTKQAIYTNNLTVPNLGGIIWFGDMRCGVRAGELVCRKR
jgi:hypothetical protein